MKSNYKRLGDYIESVNRRNVECEITDLRGLSLTKEFRKSTSNIVGTDMSTYKIMHKYDFAANFMGLGVLVDKAAIVLKMDETPNIVSGAYPVFKVKNENVLHPEYLMMWLIRGEFDRFCVFKSDSGIRGGFDWADLLEISIPVPSINKQKEVVNEYNVVKNRINLNQQLIKKLEQTATAIYKQWFVDFEFPNEKEKSHKSSGGLMIWNEEMQKEIPSEWEVDELRKIVLFKNGKTKPTKKGLIPVYGGNGIIEYVDKNNDENVIAIGRVGAYCGSLFRVLGKCWISDNAISAQSKNRNNMFTYYVLKDLKLNERSEGTGQPLITQNLLNNIRVIIPERDVIDNFEKIAFTIFKYQDILNLENEKLNEMKNLLLSKLATL